MFHWVNPTLSWTAMVNRVRRLIDKPKKNRCFLKTDLFDVAFSKKPENRI